MQRQVFSYHIRHIQLGKYLCDFPAPVCSEIKTDSNIAILNSREWLLIFCNDHSWFYKFIGNIFIVRIFNCRNRISGFFTNPIYQSIISKFYSFPSFIPIHGIIPAANRGNLSN